MRPVIGVSTFTRELPTPFGPLDSHVGARLYTSAITDAGGIPVLLPVTDNAESGAEVTQRLDGLCITGGGDIDPAMHGRTEADSVYAVDRERDEYELALTRAAHRRRLPLLAVCRGAQIVNVAFGGDLVIDIATETGGAVVHRLDTDGEVAVHTVRIDSGSQLGHLLGAEEFEVNSSHHQATRRLGDGLRAVAWTEDGVVEAIEAEDAAWPMWAVQWHPEFRKPDTIASRRLFDALVTAARDSELSDSRPSRAASRGDGSVHGSQA